MPRWEAGRWGVLAVGAGLRFIVGRDGTPGWQCVLVPMVILAGALAWLALAQARPSRRIGGVLAAQLVAVGSAQPGCVGTTRSGLRRRRHTS